MERIKFKNKENVYIQIILFVLIFINLFIFSSVSPIHNILNLQYDQMIYRIIGKGIKYGKVPYIDLIDHKGIYLFLCYALGELICEYRHIGIFIITLLINYAYAYFTYKIVFLLSNKKMVSLFTSFAIVVLQNTYFLSVNGLECETIILPFVMIAFYLMFKYLLIIKDEYPLKYIFIDGILFGIIIFIKANASLFFLAIAFSILIDHIKKRAWKHLGLIIVCGLAGVVVAILPGIIYCIVTGSLNEMIKYSFAVNLKYLGTGYPGTKSIVDAFIKTYDKFKLFTLIAGLSIFTTWYILKVNDYDKNCKIKVMIYYVFSLVITIYATFAACRPYTHYMIILLPYYITIFLFFIINFIKLFNSKKVLTIMMVISIVMLNILSYSLNLEIGLMNGSIQQSIGNKVKKIYNKEKIDFNNKKPNIYIVGFSMYIYEALNILPNERYFAIPVVLRKDYSEPYDEVIKYIESGKEEFIILTYGRTMNIDEEFRTQVEKLVNKKYVVVGKFSGVEEQIVMYKRNDSRS